MKTKTRTTILAFFLFLILLGGVLVAEDFVSKKSVKIGESGKSWEFIITEDSKHEVKATAEDLGNGIIEITLVEHENSTTGNGYKWDMALCNYTSGNLKIQYEDAQGGFNNSVWINPPDYNTLWGMESTWCENNQGYPLFSSGSKNSFPESIRLNVSEFDNFRIYAGSGSVEIDAVAVDLATAYGNSDHICTDSNGVIHGTWWASGNDLWYGNSTDGGSTWNTYEITTTAYDSSPGIICAENGDLYIYFIEALDLDAHKSTDGGASWGASFTIEDDVEDLYAQPSGVSDSNGVAHWCVTDNANDVYYINSSNLDQAVNLNVGYDGDHCAIEVDLNNNVYIVVNEMGTDDLIIFSSTTDWNTEYTINNNLGSVSSYPHSTLDIAINDYGIIGVASIHASDLAFCNGTTSDLSSWTCNELDSSTSYNPNIAITEENHTYIFYQGASSDAGDIYRANSTDMITWDTRTQVNQQGSGGWGSIAHSTYPSSNNIADTLRYLYVSVDDVWYEELTVPYNPTLLLDIIFPGYGETLTTSSGSNETLFFNFTVGGEEITSGLTIENITLNGTEVTFKFDTGFESPGTAADDSAIGTKSWSNPDNIKINDGSAAIASTAFDPGWTSHYLKATNFGFNIPAGATIEGILVQIEERDGGSTGAITDNIVKLVDGSGTVVGDNKAKAPAWTAVTTYTDYGGSTDDWNAGLSASDVNNANFGVVLSIDEVTDNFAAAAVDHVQVKVYYTLLENNGTHWNVNVTMPTLSDGTYDLTINASNANGYDSDTSEASVVYGDVGSQTNYSRNLTDSFSTNFANNEQGASQREITDSASFSDDTLSFSEIIRDLTASFSFSDVFDKLREITRNPTQDFSFSDVTNRLAFFFTALTQALSFNNLAIKGGALVNIRVFDDFSFTDSVEDNLLNVRNNINSFSFTDSVLRNINIIRDNIQETTFSFSNKEYRGLSEYFADNFGFTDSTNRVVGFTRGITQQITVNGIIDNLLQFLRNLFLTLSFSDALEAETPTSKIDLDVIYPTEDINVTQYEFFKVDLNVTCRDKTCGTVNVSLDPTSWCYQETANESTACGGLDSGSYSEGGVWMDGDWFTGQSFGTYGYVNYSKPTEATNESYWQVKAGGDTNETLNLTIGSDCWDQSPLQFRTKAGGAGAGSNDAYCWDGSDWATLQAGIGSEQTWWEEAMWWEIQSETKSGLVNTTEGATPFYTNSSTNPITTSSLGVDESETITFWVNATGDLDSVHEFFAYANLTSNESISNITDTWNVTITTGPTTYSRYSTSSLTINDALRNIGSLSKKLTDSFSFSDVTNRLILLIRLNTDNFSIVEIIDERVGAIVQVTETISINLAISINAFLEYLRDLTQGITLNFNQISLSNLQRELSDSFSINLVTENLGEFQRTVINSLGINDLVLRFGNLQRDLTNGLSLNDLVNIFSNLQRDLTQGISENDLVLKLRGVSRTQEDSFSFNDVIKRTTSLIKKPTQSVSINDAYKRFLFTTREVTNGLTIDSSTSDAYGFVKRITDSFTINNINSRMTELQRGITDSLSFNNLVSKTYTITIRVTQAISINNIVDNANAFIRLLTQAFSIVEDGFAKVKYWSEDTYPFGSGDGTATGGGGSGIGGEDEEKDEGFFDQETTLMIIALVLMFLFILLLVFYFYKKQKN